MDDDDFKSGSAYSRSDDVCAFRHAQRHHEAQRDDEQRHEYRRREQRKNGGAERLCFWRSSCGSRLECEHMILIILSKAIEYAN